MAADLVTLSDLGVELMHDASSSLVKLAADRVKELRELVDLILNVLNVVAHNIQWVPHLMRDCGVDQSYELALALERVLRQDFVGHIHEANNERRVNLVDLFVDGNLFQLELLERWEEVALNKVNILEALDDGLEDFVHVLSFE